MTIEDTLKPLQSKQSSTNQGPEDDIHAEVIGNQAILRRLPLLSFVAL